MLFWLLLLGLVFFAQDIVVAADQNLKVSQGSFPALYSFVYGAWHGLNQLNGAPEQVARFATGNVLEERNKRALDLLLDLPPKVNTKSDAVVWQDKHKHFLRASMVYDLTHRYPLIGVERNQVRMLLGVPGISGIVDPENPTNSDTDWYWMDGKQFCANAGADVLELSYRNNRVAAYRCVSAAFR